MPNSQRLDTYPVLLFDAFYRAETEDPVILDCGTPAQARNLRSLCYTMRRLCSESQDEGYAQLYLSVARRKFYVDGAQLIIASPMYYSTKGTTIQETPHA